MITDFLQQFTTWFVEHGYLGVFLATLGFFPAEIVIALVAALRPTEVIWISLVACLGEAVGGIPTYLVGYVFNEEKVYAWINGRGKFLGIKQGDVEKSIQNILKRGFWYILISRLLPWIRIAAALGAGFIEMKLVPFILGTFVGTFLYAFPIAYIGSRVGANWEEIQRHLGIYNNWIIGLVIAYVLVSTVVKYQKRIISVIKRLFFKKSLH